MKKTLEERDSFSSTVLHSLGLPLYVLNPDYSCHFANAEFAKLLGKKTEDIIGKQSDALLFSDEVELYLNLASQVFETGKRQEVEVQISPSKDEALYFKKVYNPVFNESGEVILVSCVYIDITDTKKAERKLEESEALVQNLYKASSGGFFLHENGNILECNEVMANILGYSVNELIGMDGLLLVADKSQQVVIDKVRSGWEEPYEAYGLHKTGQKVPVLLYPQTIQHNGKIVRIVGLQDLTKLKLAEEKLFQTQKLETLGSLVGGITHDCNNLLSGILGHLALIKVKKSQGDRDMYISLAIEATSRAGQLCAKLFSFTRVGASDAKVVPINRVLENAVNFVAILEEGIDCKFKLSEKRLYAKIDEGEIYSVFNNLALNSIQAMSGKGTIKISSEMVVLEKNMVSGLEKDGAYIRVIIRDSGCGIPEELLSNVFQPYYTTKKHGSGFGLANAYKAVQNYGGTITAESKEGEGATFFVYLPAYADAEVKP